MSKDKPNEKGEKKHFANANKYIAIAFAGIIATSLSVISLMGGVANAQQPQPTMQNNVVRDSVLLTGPRTIPAGDFIHVYDSTPYMIMSGHVAIKVPCDAYSNTPIQVLTGQAPNLKPADMELIKPLSTPGQQCLYHVDLASNQSATAGNSTIITDVAIKNAGTQDINLTGTSTVFVGVNEIRPGAEESGHEHAEMNMTGTNMIS
jgi:hypothetical protein